MTALPQGRNIEVTLCTGAVGLNGPTELDWDFLGYHGIEWAVNAKSPPFRAPFLRKIRSVLTAFALKEWCTRVPALSSTEQRPTLQRSFLSEGPMCLRSRRAYPSTPTIIGGPKCSGLS